MRLAALLVAIGSVACTSSPGGDVDAGDVPDAGGADAGTGRADAGPSDSAAASWCARWADAWCGAVGRCVPAGSAWNEATCRADVARDCPSGAPVEAAVVARRLEYDAGAAATCLNELSTLGCGAFVDAVRANAEGPVPACARVLTGLAGAGEHCFLGNECAAGMRCQFGATCPGICTPWATTTCSDSNPCDPGRALCDNGTCRSFPAAVGVACPDRACVAPLACNPSSLECEALLVPGATCSIDTPPCFPGLVCVTQDGNAGVCAPPRSLDQPCFADAQCGLDGSGASLVCSGGSCRLPPPAGEPCENYRCRDAWCDTTKLPPTCVGYPGSGAACLPNGACAAGLACLGGSCAAKLATGATCTEAASCADGRCVAGHCIATGAAACAP